MTTSFEWIRGVCESFLDFSGDDWKAMVGRTSAPHDGTALSTFVSSQPTLGVPLYVYAVHTDADVCVAVKKLEEIEEEVEVDVE